jgi:mRNA-decapping enzyme subunit 2
MFSWSRFILNLPDEELASLERICFQVEQAYVYVIEAT